MIPTIRSLDDLQRLRGKKVVCLASGGVDSSYLLKRLYEVGALVTPVFVDTLPAPHGRAVFQNVCASLTLEPLTVDAVKRFAREFVAPAIRAHATYLGTHPISSSLSRPLLSQVGVEIATQRGADALLHSSTASQNSLRRFNRCIADLAFAGDYGSPFEQSYVRRAEKMATLADLSLASGWSEYSIDENAWARSVESGALDDPERDWGDESAYEWSRIQPGCSELTISVGFEGGVPTHLDGESVALEALFARLNRVVGERGVGRYRSLEENGAGRKVQEFREAPAATLLLDAFRRLESACIDAECIREKMAQEQLWVREAVEGRWFGPLRQAADAFISRLAAEVSGRVTFELSERALRFACLHAPAGQYLRSRTQVESTQQAHTTA